MNPPSTACVGMVPVSIVLLGSWLGMTSPVPRVIPGGAQVADPFEWETLGTRFVKVFPKDYKRALGERIAAESGNG